MERYQRTAKSESESWNVRPGRLYAGRNRRRGRVIIQEKRIHHEIREQEAEQFDRVA